VILLAVFVIPVVLVGWFLLRRSKARLYGRQMSKAAQESRRFDPDGPRWVRYPKGRWF